MLKALISTITELLDSKKAAYSFLATALAVVLHLQFGVSPESALILVSPLALATAAQAHVDAKLGAARASTSTADTSSGSGAVTPDAVPSTGGPSEISGNSSRG